ncbi:hypothetical protein AAFF_G00339590 [Aldrovandia affinis]|uniref:Uncharacterized protein n=1 Tax=Aldrovandia affinis TaxID=143900 RepID=A0AAD7WP27_9TELE|nr:hypothetical protein AAFF_G00339590 [Aldrovandia affinis]
MDWSGSGKRERLPRPHPHTAAQYPSPTTARLSRNCAERQPAYQNQHRPEARGPTASNMRSSLPVLTLPGPSFTCTNLPGLTDPAPLADHVQSQTSTMKDFTREDAFCTAKGRH